MDARFGVGAVSVSERAVSGTTTRQLLEGTDTRNRPWPAEVATDVVLVNFGINEQRTGVSVEHYEADLTELGRRLHMTAPHAVLVFETPNPVHRYAWASDAYAVAMRRVAIALKTPLADVNHFLGARADWQGLVPDGAHPADATYLLLVRDVLMPVLVPIVVGFVARRASHPSRSAKGGVNN